MPILLAADIVEGRFAPQAVETAVVDGRTVLRLHAPGRSVFIEKREAARLMLHLRRGRSEFADRIDKLLSELD